MEQFRADLHCHTTCSDGSMTPAALIELALSTPLQGLCITDHDTIEAYKEAIPLAKAKGLLLGTGIEFSSQHQGKSVHILGYDISLDSQDLKDLCMWHKTRRLERNRKILEKLAKAKKPIEESDLKGTGVIGRPHIAQAMVEKGYVQSIREAFNVYIGDDKCCYDPGPAMGPLETIDVIHKAGGKAFLAHPHLITGGAWLKEVLKFPFDGIECHYSKCFPSEEKRWIKMAEKKKLLISGGSDFHGSVKPHIPLGCSWVDEKTFRSIFEKNLIE